ncbi:hypothetical protein GCM10010840_18180 [Deinococcus aerolatus]|uniref:Uncharacterized protein n=1 Tax=Deinococcus aerolatus TaxID=522487 RepID=A0ABQ2G937_9DEIO|nr:hypothetical protein [Deinococcus aerolatus]GGL80727.1 hypothetical protein GCM10010840_18180 [Deinococcus aerolatus]
MKKLLIPPAVLGLSALLAACGGGTTPPSSSAFALTVNVAGVSGAPVKITNTISNTTLFDGTLTGSKTFGDVAAGSVLNVQGGAVNSYATPAAQSVTLDNNKSVTLEYKAAAQAGVAVSNTQISGKIGGTDLQIDSANLLSHSDPFFGEAVVRSNVLTLDLALLVPAPDDLLGGFYSTGCSGTNTDASALILDSLSLNAYSPQGDLIGTIREKIVSGPDAALPNALVYRLYSDRAFIFRGECQYNLTDGTVITEKNDIQAVKGWNTLVFAGEGQNVTVKNAASGNRAELTFTSAAPRVAVRLDPESLTFSDEDQLTVNARLIQIGNYSGVVKLSTDIAGLSVEPATLTLNPLPKMSGQSTGGQSARLKMMDLQPQLLATKLTFKYTGTTNLSNKQFEVLVKDSNAKQVGSGTGKITVTRAGIAVFLGTQDLELPPSSSRVLPVMLNSVGNFRGKVTVSVSGLPSGVSTTPVDVDLNGYGSAQLVLTSSAALKSGTYPLTITAQSGASVTRADFNLVVPRPTVSVKLGSTSFYPLLPQGETTTVAVELQSQNGFSGSTSVQITGLPIGVTSAPVNARITPNTTTTVQVPLTATVDAKLGSSSALVSSPYQVLNQSTYERTLNLNVVPARVALGPNVGFALAAGSEGIWFTSSVYDTTQTNYIHTVKHIVAGKITASHNVKNSASNLLSMSDGSVLAFDTSSADTFQISDQGVKALSSKPYALASAPTNGAMDGQNRIWFIQETPVGIGGVERNLAYWDVVTGSITTIRSPHNFNTSGAFTRSNDGRIILYTSYALPKALKIDTSTGAVSEIGLSIGGEPGSVSYRTDGLVYFLRNRQLSRINSDDSITTLDGIGMVERILGFDRKNPDILWAISDSSVLKVNVLTNEVIKTFVGNSAGVLLTDGGVGLIISQWASTGSGYDRFLSILR